MSNKRMVPDIRFKGFEDSWAKNTLSNFCSITTGKLDANAMCKNGEYDFFTCSQEKFKINNWAFQGPAITVVGNGASVGFTHIAEGKFNAYQRTYVLSDFNDSYHQFLINCINNNLPAIIEEESRAGNIPYIVKDMLEQLAFYSCSNNEQYKIGEFFKNIDNLITQTSNNLDKLKDVKKSLLKKMFPSEGKFVPEIRFSQFNDLWKVVKLNEISRYTISNLNVSDANYNGKYALYDALCKIGYTDKTAINKPYITIIKDGAGIGRVRVLQENTMFIGTMGAIHNNQEVNINFLYHIMSKFDFSISSIGTAIPHIYWSDYSENLVEISELIEQSKIAEFLTAVDKLITLTNKKLTKLKDIKKALLQKMFV